MQSLLSKEKQKQLIVEGLLFTGRNHWKKVEEVEQQLTSILGENQKDSSGWIIQFILDETEGNAEELIKKLEVKK